MRRKPNESELALYVVARELETEAWQLIRTRDPLKAARAEGLLTAATRIKHQLYALVGTFDTKRRKPVLELVKTHKPEK